MAIFKKKKVGTKTGRKVVGAYIPLPLAEYLAMYALSNDISVGSVIGDLLEDWKKEKEQIVTKEQLINLLAMR